MILTIFIGALLVLFIIGVPAAFALGLTSLIVTVVDRGIDAIPFTIIAQRMVYGVNSFPLLAIPFFILAGKIMNSGGVTDRIFVFARRLVGHWRGGLGQVNIAASIIFSGMSGSAVADAVGIGQVEIRAMRQAGYPDDFSVAVTAASATIGPIIPPSIPLIVYAVIANASATSLLIAGLLPGLVLAGMLMIVVAIRSRKLGVPTEVWQGFGALIASFFAALPAIITPVIIIGGMWTGAFTPTEAAAIAAVYALIISLLVYREMTLERFWIVLKETMRETAIILIIIAAAALYAWLLVFSQIPQELVALVDGWSLDPYLLLLLINIFLLVIGLFMETNAAITIFTPMLLPLAVSVGIDPVHFGVVMVLNLMIGLLTPPVGMVLFAVAKVGDVSINRAVAALAPFYLPLILALLIVTYVPQISLLLPSLMR
ncbi:TRAP transporter large permease [Acuticoccus sp. M5D2P5]|uniref:TRAP transporter large permease n=1 Tax=Acuticoccus kalidii TaxID=2910977 RepID=UPI001F217B9C|nr:TRAP transporter large permease [Acuticoccus kalidii]MCF3933241.1 TRAP transporter large permease [Acuticoccus kalidii]